MITHSNVGYPVPRSRPKYHRLSFPSFMIRKSRKPELHFLINEFCPRFMYLHTLCKTRQSLFSPPKSTINENTPPNTKRDHLEDPCCMVSVIYNYCKLLVSSSSQRSQTKAIASVNKQQSCFYSPISFLNRKSRKPELPLFHQRKNNSN